MYHTQVTTLLLGLLLSPYYGVPTYLQIELQSSIIYWIHFRKRLQFCHLGMSESVRLLVTGTEYGIQQHCN